MINLLLFLLVGFFYILFFTFLTHIITSKLRGVSEQGVQSCMLIIQALSGLFPMVFMGSVYGGLCRFYTCLKISTSDFFLAIWIFFSHLVSSLCGSL